MIANTTVIAAVSLTISVEVRYFEARCPTCDRRLVSIPSATRPQMIRRDSEEDRSGRGIAVRCGRCKTLVEVIV